MNATQTNGYAWITGGGSGIGRALALQLAGRGWRVAVSGRNERRLQAVGAEAPPGSIVPVPMDVTEPEQVEQAVASTICRNSCPGLVVLNAGDYRPMSLASFDPSLFAHLMQVNFLGVVNCLAAVAPRMLELGSGQILINASLAGYRGLPNAAPYGASKAALINMAEALRPEFADRGVALRVVNPGFVATDLTSRNDFDMPALISVERAAESIVAALPGKSFEISFPWRFALFMKLLRILPDGLYFALTRRLAA